MILVLKKKKLIVKSRIYMFIDPSFLVSVFKSDGFATYRSNHGPLTHSKLWFSEALWEKQVLI